MLSHLDKKGNAKIVDISSKKVSSRIAISVGKISVNKIIIEQIKKNGNKKGDIFTIAKIAGIMAAKKTSEFIPLCHPLKIDDVQIKFTIDEINEIINVETYVKCIEKTGVEMESLSATSVALLTIYDMCKAVSHDMKIFDIRLLKKIGGKKIVKTIDT